MDKQVFNLSRYIILVVLAILGGYFLFQYFTEPKFDIRQFTGNVVSIKDEAVTLKGVFVGTIPENLLVQREFTFRVDKSTRFEKIETRFPTWEELKAMGAVNGNSARYNLEDLPRTKETGSFDDLTSSLHRGDIFVEADFTASIYHSRNPVASFVFYNVLVPTPSLPASP